MKIREVDIPDNRPFIVRASEYKPANDFNPPKTLGRPRGKTEEAKRVMAMDACIKNVLSGFRSELYNAGTPMFAGYGLLSSISQEALIRAGVETIADEMTRKFVKFRYDVDDSKDDHEQEISDLEEQAAKYKIKDIFNDAAQKDGYFGGCLVYIDVGDLDDEEALEPLTLDKKTFKKGMLKGFKVIEPINIYPGEYNTTDPTDEHYFNPEYWYILGRRYHASRFLYFVSNSVPVLLKPSYNFFGIARAQLALDYIAHFVENRESAQELLNKFSLTCWKTDMTQVLAGESCQDLVKRVRMFNKMKSNNGTLVVDKEKEDIMQINTPLSGVRDIVDMSLSLLTAVWRIPKIKYIGEGEGGLNASSKEQMRSFYDFILSQKEKMFTQPMETVLKILQLNMGKDINESIGFEFPSMVEMDDADIAQLNKMKADTAVQLINAGVVSQEEVRQNLSMDKHSGFSMIDVDDIPEEPEQPNEKEIVEVEDEDLVTDERWITVKPNGEEEKGRHLLLEGEGENQETPAEAMKRQWKVDITKKENKVDKEENKVASSESTFVKTPAIEYGELLDKEQNVGLSELEEKRKKELEEKEGFGQESKFYSEKIRNAKTIQEAQEIAKVFVRDGGNVHFSNRTKVENANEMNKTIAQLADKYGMNYKYKDYGDNTRGKSYYAHANESIMEGNVSLLMSLDKDGLDAIYKKSVSEFKKNAEKTINRWVELRDRGVYSKEYAQKYINDLEKKLKYERFTVFDKDNIVKSIFTHEFGHTLYFDRMKKEIELAGFEEWNSFGHIKRHYKKTKLETKAFLITRKAYREAKKNGDIYKISNYASSNQEEFFAECFAMRELGQKVPKYIDEMLKEVIEK